jgi:hypothetical protein
LLICGDLLLERGVHATNVSARLRMLIELFHLCLTAVSSDGFLVHPTLSIPRNRLFLSAWRENSRRFVQFGVVARGLPAIAAHTTKSSCSMQVGVCVPGCAAGSAEVRTGGFVVR